MEIQISRRIVIRILVVIGLPLFIAAVYWVGTRVTPYAGDGAPLLLSPTLRESIAYRGQVIVWQASLQEIDNQLVKLQTSRDVYEQTQQAEAILASTRQVAQEAQLRHAPSALAGLKTLVTECSQAYYATAQAAAQWVGAPSPENAQAVQEAIATARAARKALTESRWLQETSPTSSSPSPARPGGSPTKQTDTLDLPSP